MTRPRSHSPKLVPTPTGATNLHNFGRTRRLPARGDLIAANVLGTRWIVGRVIATDSTLGGFRANTVLTYFYDMNPDDPRTVATPILPQLLVAPMGIDVSAWTLGYLALVRETELQPSELLPRHVFRSDTKDPYVDEYGRPTHPPEPNELCKSDGKGFAGFVDVVLSDALGIPKFKPPPPPTVTLEVFSKTPFPPPKSAKSRPPRRTVTLYIPGAIEEGRFADIDALEDEIESAIKAAKAGRWQGRGTDLETKISDYSISGPDPVAILGIMIPILRKHRAVLPPGWSIVAEDRAGALFTVLVGDR